MQKFHGVWPALVTPYTAQNEIAVDAINALIDYLLDKQVDGFYLCGSTGQGVHQCVAERKLVTETALRRIDGRVPAIVHVGSQALGDAVELAVHAEVQGAAGVSSIIPAGYDNLESIGHYYAAVAASVPTLAFLPYLFTSTSSAVALIQSISKIPNLTGAKYTGPNMFELSHVIQARDEPWSVFSGMDEQCVFAAMFGACGNIGSTLNVMPGVYRQIHGSYASGDLLQARDLQARANRVTETMISFGFMGALYAAMDMLGIECGEPRLPAMPLFDDRKRALRAALEENDFATLAAM
jgi:N-acetylneuraminate lyase